MIRGNFNEFNVKNYLSNFTLLDENFFLLMLSRRRIKNVETFFLITILCTILPNPSLELKRKGSISQRKAFVLRADEEFSSRLACQRPRRAIKIEREKRLYALERAGWKRDRGDRRNRWMVLLGSVGISVSIGSEIRVAKV